MINTVTHMKLQHTILVATALSTIGASAAITYIHSYDMGEAGSLGTNNRPLDGTGSINFTGGNGGVLTVIGSAPGGSTAHSSFNGTNQGIYSADFGTLPTNNFAVEFWARTSDLTQTNQILSLAGNNSGSVKIGTANGNW